MSCRCCNTGICPFVAGPSHSQFPLTLVALSVLSLICAACGFICAACTASHNTSLQTIARLGASRPLRHLGGRPSAVRKRFRETPGHLRQQAHHLLHAFGVACTAAVSEAQTHGGPARTRWQQQCRSRVIRSLHATGGRTPPTHPSTGLMDVPVITAILHLLGPWPDDRDMEGWL